MKLIIFDIDGTLVYSERLDSQCFADTYQEVYKKPFPSIDWTRYPHVVDTIIFSTVIEEHFRRKPDQAEMDDFQALFCERITAQRKKRPQEFKEVPGAKQMVEQLLQDAGYVVGIGTGGWSGPARIKLKHVGIPDEELILSAADRRHSREDILQAAIEEAAERYDGFEQIVYVGDALWDVQTTRNMQLDFIGMRRKRDVEVLLQAGASQVFADYLQPDHFLEAIERAKPPR
ncbi:MAG: HAD family hydrolase [Saprospiraceae bacterium]|nr:HAD family hydrolase [Saprospiraceae bacterium]